MSERFREGTRLRWRSRRGLLELDLMLQGFLNHYGHTLSEAEKLAYEGLLEQTDPELLGLILGTQTKQLSPEQENLIDRIRMDKL
jgi:succinate dehydrogenase flavin-adding protein (antitoxin of CptAB toxin-antitoxin module)